MPSSFSIVSQAPGACSTSPPVSFRVRPQWEWLFLELRRPPDQLTRSNNGKDVTTRPTNVRVVPIDYAFGLALGPANPAQMNFTQEPLDFRRQSLSLCLSLIMPSIRTSDTSRTSRVSLRRPTERSATAPGTRNQASVIRPRSV